MAKHDAVDRLMAMASEKRADRTPSGPVTVSTQETAPAATLDATLPAALVYPENSRPSAGERGRQVLQAIRPLLPAVAGAMRLVDHGAVQALARLLPLLGVGLGAAGPSSNERAANERAAQERGSEELLDLRTEQQGQRRKIEALEGRGEEQTAELRRLRSQVERQAAEETGRVLEIRNLSDRVRLLTACTIILLMLVVAQMILLVVIFHK